MLRFKFNACSIGADPPKLNEFDEGIRIPRYSTDPHKIAVGRGWTTVWLAGLCTKTGGGCGGGHKEGITVIVGIKFE